MMFNINCLNNIRNLDTRKYFQDTLQAFYSKNYRAAIILLYTTTIFDLIEKMYKMNEKNYINASLIINRIDENRKKEEKKLSEIEDEVLKFYLDRKYFDDDLIDDISYLKNLRNRCAHPTFYMDGLYNPTEEQVYMLIKRMLDKIFSIEYIIKNPIDFIKNDIDKMDNDYLSEEIGIVDRKEEITKISKVFGYNYYSCLSDDGLKKLLNDLFELSIAKRNEDTEPRQYKTFLVLEALITYVIEIGKINLLSSTFKFNKININDLKENLENEYGGWRATEYLLIIIKNKKYLFLELEESNPQIYEFLKSEINKEEYLDNYWSILYEDKEEYILEFLKSKAGNKRILKFYESNKNDLKKEFATKTLIKLFETVSNVNAFNEADRAMELLLDYLRKYPCNQKEVEIFLLIMNKNRQFYDYSRKQSLQNLIDIEFLGFSLNGYNNLEETRRHE